LQTGAPMPLTESDRRFHNLGYFAHDAAQAHANKTAIIDRAGGEPREVAYRALEDLYTTNICFGGPELRTAYITLSNSGRLVALDWPRPGLALNYLN
jgi:sugar lactone lactonase YvrE